MDEQDIDQAAEIVGVAKELFRAFEVQLGEVMATQRLASKEANEALAETRKSLRGLLQHAKEAGEVARAAQEELRRGWQLHVAENSKAAGSEMARRFGEEIAKGLEKRLAELTRDAEIATRRLTWESTLTWVVGLVIAIPLSINIGIRAFMPTIDEMSLPGLSVSQTHDVVSRITLCWPRHTDILDQHVCVMTDDPPKVTRAPHDEAAVVVRGM